MKINPELGNIYRKDVIKESKMMTEYIRWYDSLRVRPITYYFSQQDIAYINKLAKSPSMQLNTEAMFGLLDELMKERGFVLAGGGTNRRAYECTFDPGVVAKIAINQVGMENNKSDLLNQNVLKPVCAKTFESTYCGTLALDEYVVPFKTIAEYTKYAQEIFDILYFKLRNNSILMDDIGTSRFKQWGYRNNFGPVILDYPTMYVADPKKRLCRSIHNGCICNGTIDYDDGFNHIVCSECGRIYRAHELKKPDGEDIDRLMEAINKKKSEGVKRMAIKIIDHETGIVEKETTLGGTSSYVDLTKTNIFIQNNPCIFNDTSKVKKKKVMVVDAITREEEVPSVQEYPLVVEKFSSDVDKRIEFMNKFNNRNLCTKAGIVPENSSSLNTEELIEVLRNGCIKENPFISREDAFELYAQVSIATMYPFGDIPRRIDRANLGVNGMTLVNNMLRDMSGITDLTYNMFDVFYRMLLHIRNSKSFFTSIINFWYTLLEMNSFDTDESPDGSVHCIYSDIMRVYYDAVKSAFEDFKYNIKLNGSFIYTAQNVLNFIIKGVSDMNFVTVDEFGSIDTNKFICVHASMGYAEFSEIETTKKIPEEELAPAVEESVPAVEEAPKEEVKEEEPSAVELYEKYVAPQEEAKPKRKSTSKKKKDEEEDSDDGKPKKKVTRKKKAES